MADPRSNGSDLRRAILDRTRRMLVEVGYNNLSMRKIARSVGCSATSIYLHFENKDALLHALIDEGMTQLNASLQEVAAAHADPAERLEALSLSYMQFGLENPEYYEVMFMLHPERMARYPAEKYRRARRNLELSTEALTEGVEAGQFSVEDPAVTASVLWAALHGAVSLLIARRVDVRFERDAFAKAMVQHTLAGLGIQVGAPHADG